MRHVIAALGVVVLVVMLAFVAPSAEAKKDAEAVRLAKIEKNAEKAVKRIVKAAAKRIKSRAAATAKEIKALTKAVRRGEFAAKQPGGDGGPAKLRGADLRAALDSYAALLTEFYGECSGAGRDAHLAASSDSAILSAGAEQLPACQSGMPGFSQDFVDGLASGCSAGEAKLAKPCEAFRSSMADAGLRCSEIVYGVPPFNGLSCTESPNPAHATTSIYSAIGDEGGGFNIMSVSPESTTFGTPQSRVSLRDPLTQRQVIPLESSQTTSFAPIRWKQVANSFSGAGGEFLAVTVGDRGGASEAACAVVPPSSTPPAEAGLRQTMGAVTGLPGLSFVVNALARANEVFNSALELARKFTGGLVDAVAAAACQVARGGGASKLALLSDELFPCGQGPNGFTVCADIAAGDPGGDLLVVGVAYDADIPLSDPTNLYQYGFVFDQDGSAANNYVPIPQFAGDYFQDSDKWYAVEYAPGTGWRLKVTDARNGNFVPVASAARAIINGSSIVLAVPASEFAVESPAYRTTSFRHSGDFGQNPPFDWLADYDPVPGKPLRPFPTE